MGIDRAQLYGTPNGDGSASSSAVTQATAQIATFTIPRTEPPAAPLSAPFLARSVAVDNATGRWWRVAGRRIPPWTIGAIVPVDPPSAQLLVEAVTPTGQLSEAVGDELVLVLSSAPQLTHPGIYVPPRNVLTPERAVAFPQADSPPYAATSTVTLIPASADEQLVIVSVTAAVTGGLRWLRSVQYGVYYAPPSVVVADLVMTAEAPTVRHDFEPGSVIVPAGLALEVSGYGRSTSGLIEARVTVLFHRSPVS